MVSNVLATPVKGTRSYFLGKIAESEGYNNWQDMIEGEGFRLLDSIVPAICIKCEAITEMEPDQDAGYCEECDTNNVRSCLILAGMI